MLRLEIRAFWVCIIQTRRSINAVSFQCSLFTTDKHFHWRLKHTTAWWRWCDFVSALSQIAYIQARAHIHRTSRLLHLRNYNQSLKTQKHTAEQSKEKNEMMKNPTAKERKISKSFRNSQCALGSNNKWHKGNQVDVYNSSALIMLDVSDCTAHTHSLIRTHTTEHRRKSALQIVWIYNFSSLHWYVLRTISVPI